MVRGGGRAGETKEHFPLLSCSLSLNFSAIYGQKEGRKALGGRRPRSKLLDAAVQPQVVAVVGRVVLDHCRFD